MNINELINSSILVNEKDCYYPTLAGLLCFGKVPGKYYPNYMALCGAYKEDSLESEVISEKNISGTLPELIEDSIGGLPNTMTLENIKYRQYSRNQMIASYLTGFEYIDFLINVTEENARKMLTIIEEFGFDSLNLTEKDFLEKFQIIQLGYAPVRIDIITGIKGIDFIEVYKNKIESQYDNEKVYYISCADLIKSKIIANRDKDKLDIKNLLKIHKL